MPLPSLPWPEETPEGLSFPYSHFGDPLRRVVLLQNIAQTVGFNPNAVINLGAGYDVTPSIAFPEARVVHTEIQPEIASFLGSVGFEVYGPQTVPEDLQPDLAISILGPNVEGYDVGLADKAFYISTAAESRYIPENMTLTALVDDELRIVTDINKMEELWDSENYLHVGVYATEAALFSTGREGLQQLS